MLRSADLHIMIKAVEKAAAAIVRDFGELEKLQVSKKGVKNFVTSSDKFAEQRLMRDLSSARPAFSFVCEESGNTENLDSDDVWIIDPIDGTNNFMRGIPYFSINVALMRKKEIVAAVTFDPIRADCFCSDAGKGAFLGNRNRLRVSGRTDIKGAVIAVHGSANVVETEFSKFAIFRKTGSVALDLAYLAAGKYDVVIAKNVSIWDIASGILLIKEAGGFLNYIKTDDGKYSILAASSSKFLNQINPFFTKA